MDYEHQTLLSTQNGYHTKSARLMNVIGTLNQKYGRNTVSVFSAGSNTSWSMQRESMSPCYTTDWQEVPVAYAH
ncbi:DUF4113 domain-containing protein [Nitrosomonas communis]|uniref:DUF4113 domain-containing protein n=1 Tax=Nitrosomonas communis TaxID=44574 RepID=UPI0011601193|nr:DUF4113 domain-containing protein [Nitrosomonas communis]